MVKTYFFGQQTFLPTDLTGNLKSENKPNFGQNYVDMRCFTHF